MNQVDGTKFVDFELYCNKCKHKELKEYEEPCHRCLNEPVNTYSEKPVCYEEKDK